MRLVVWTGLLLVVAAVLRLVRDRASGGGAQLLRRAAGAAVLLCVAGLGVLTWWPPTSQTDVVYSGSYVPLRGIPTSEAYSSTLQISFDSPYGASGLNLLPFHSILSVLRPLPPLSFDNGTVLADPRTALRQHLEVELVTLLPLGALLPLLGRRRDLRGDLRLVAASSAAVGLVLAVGQRLLPIDQPLDIDVVIVNVLGATVLTAVAHRLATRLHPDQ